METQEGPHDLPVPSTDARAALAAVADCNRQMVEQMRAPWWYHVGLGALAGCLCLSVTLSPLEVLATLAVVGAGAGLLVRSYVRHTGAWVSGYRAGRTRWVSVGLGAVAGVGYTTAWFMASRPWIAALIALAVVIAVSVAGWIWEAAYRRDLAESA